MRTDRKTKTMIAGSGAGLINGLFGAGGGMVLVPLLTSLTDTPDDEIFPTSVSIILPVCLVSLGFSLWQENISWETSLPYLFGSAAGGVAAGFWSKKIPTKWLHKILGILIIWGGVRYLC